MTDSTTTIATTTNVILALDLGKFKSVACRFDPVTGEHAFETIAPRAPILCERDRHAVSRNEPTGAL